MSKKVKNIILVSFAILGLVTAIQTVTNSEFIAYGYVNLEDESASESNSISANNDEKTSLEKFIETHHTPFSKTIVKN